MQAALNMQFTTGHLSYLSLILRQVSPLTILQSSLLLTLLWCHSLGLRRNATTATKSVRKINFLAPFNIQSSKCLSCMNVLVPLLMWMQVFNNLSMLTTRWSKVVLWLQQYQPIFSFSNRAQDPHVLSSNYASQAIIKLYSPQQK